MEKRTLLAIVLMAVVLALSQYFLTPTRPKEEGKATPASPDTAPTAPTGAAPAPPGAAPAEEAGAPTAAGAYAAPGGGSLTVETPLYDLTLDRQGGVVTRVSLKRYPSFVDRRSPVQIVPPGLSFFQRSLRGPGQALDLTDVQFDAARSRLRVTDRPDSLVLIGRTPEGATLIQTYEFDPGTYTLDYRLDADGAAAPGTELVTHLGPRLRSNEKNLKEDLGNFAAVARVNGEVHTLKASSDDLPAGFQGSSNWAGLKSKYFVSALISHKETFDRVQVSAVRGDSLPGLDVAVGLPLEGGRAGYRLYLGPQEYRGLAAAGEGFEDVNQYGWSWIRWLVQPVGHVILRFLLWMHQYVHNYGVVLIIFGVLVRLVMWPLTQKSFESMQRMQSIQPEINKMRERYKNDPQRMQQELMRLYKDRGVNPLGGCLPNLLPLPVLFALFFVFQGTIEFRGAPFLGWIQDLSRPDPLYVLPVLMGATMFVQQKLTVSPASMKDNPQMKMMTYFMPAFMTFIFLNLASGLVLYYTVSQSLTIVQQVLLKRRLEARQKAAPGGDEA